MLFTYLLPSLLVTSAVALPVADIGESEDNLVLFKRDDILSARDIELANIHGVDLTESKTLLITLRTDADQLFLVDSV